MQYVNLSLQIPDTAKHNVLPRLSTFSQIPVQFFAAVTQKHMEMQGFVRVKWLQGFTVFEATEHIVLPRVFNV